MLKLIRYYLQKIIITFFSLKAIIIRILTFIFSVPVSPFVNSYLIYKKTNNYKNGLRLFFISSLYLILISKLSFFLIPFLVPLADYLVDSIIPIAYASSGVGKSGPGKEPFDLYAGISKTQFGAIPNSSQSDATSSQIIKMQAEAHKTKDCTSTFSRHGDKIESTLDCNEVKLAANLEAKFQLAHNKSIMPQVSLNAGVGPANAKK